MREDILQIYFGSGWGCYGDVMGTWGTLLGDSVEFRPDVSTEPVARCVQAVATFAICGNRGSLVCGASCSVSHHLRSLADQPLVFLITRLSPTVSGRCVFGRVGRCTVVREHSGCRSIASLSI